MWVNRSLTIYIQREAVPESLKNVLLVMQASEALQPPQNPDNRPEELQRRWKSTQEKVDLFLPGFLVEVIPVKSAPVEPETSQSTGVDVTPHAE